MHTPTPWWNDLDCINGSENESIANTCESNKNRDADAAFIVTACNAHGDLVKAVKYAVSVLESLPENMLNDLQDNILDESIDWKVFVDALAKAGVKS